MFAGGSGVVYGYGVRCSIADQVVVGVGVISGTSDVLCGVSCEEGEQATAIKKIDTITAANGPNAFEYFLDLIFPLASSRTRSTIGILPAIIVLVVIL